MIVGLVWALVTDLRNDPMMVRRRYAEAAVEKAVVTGAARHGDDFELRVGPADEPLNRAHQLVGSGRPSWKPAAD